MLLSFRCSAFPDLDWQPERRQARRRRRRRPGRKLTTAATASRPAPAATPPAPHAQLWRRGPPLPGGRDAACPQDHVAVVLHRPSVTGTRTSRCCAHTSARRSRAYA